MLESARGTVLFFAMRNCTGQAFKRLLNTVKAQIADLEW